MCLQEIAELKEEDLLSISDTTAAGEPSILSEFGADKALLIISLSMYKCRYC